jgi:mono/diheme cytochrome c family protein
MRSRRPMRTACSLLLALAACGESKSAKSPATAAPAPSAAATAAPVAAATAEGVAQYAVCQTCHQADGKGLPGVYPPLAGSEWVTGPAELPIAIVLHGLQGEIVVAGVTYNNNMMPWKHLDDAQIAAALTYVRSAWGNAAPAVTAADVAKVRAATMDRPGPWTVADLKAARLQ